MYCNREDKNCLSFPEAIKLNNDPKSVTFRFLSSGADIDRAISCLDRHHRRKITCSDRDFAEDTVLVPYAQSTFEEKWFAGHEQTDVHNILFSHFE
jgi:hypothetical protein